MKVWNNVGTQVSTQAQVDSHFGSWSFISVLNIWDEVLNSTFCPNCVLFRPFKISKRVDIESEFSFFI
jgi:hypothetical protein